MGLLGLPPQCNHEREIHDNESVSSDGACSRRSALIGALNIVFADDSIIGRFGGESYAYFNNRPIENSPSTGTGMAFKSGRASEHSAENGHPAVRRALRTFFQ